jgi:hypothetical protein
MRESTVCHFLIIRKKKNNAVWQLNDKNVALAFFEEVEEKRRRCYDIGSPFDPKAFVSALTASIRREAQDQNENPDAYFSVIRSNPDERRRLCRL